MGQKVNPIGLRLTIPSSCKNPITKNKTDLHGWNNIFTSTKKTYGKDFHKQIKIKKYIENYLSKWGFILNRVIISKNFNQININISAYINKNNNIGRPYWTSRDIKTNKNFFGIHKKKFITLESLFSKYFYNGQTVKINLYDFEKEIQEKKEFINNFQKALQNNKNKQYAQDVINIVSLSFNNPVAPIIAQIISQTFEKSNNHQTIIDFFNESFKYLFIKEIKNSNKNIYLRGCLIQIKGRINGSDRSKRSIIRYGSLPLHTLTAPIDYAYKQVITPYGICSIKVWLCYKNY